MFLKHQKYVGNFLLLLVSKPHLRLKDKNKKITNGVFFFFLLGWCATFETPCMTFIIYVIYIFKIITLLFAKFIHV